MVRKTLARNSDAFGERVKRCGDALANDTDVLYSISKTDTEKAMYKPSRYVFRPARPAPALLRRIWAWF